MWVTFGAEHHFIVSSKEAKPPVRPEQFRSMNHWQIMVNYVLSVSREALTSRAPGLELENITQVFGFWSKNGLSVWLKCGGTEQERWRTGWIANLVSPITFLFMSFHTGSQPTFRWDQIDECVKQESELVKCFYQKTYRSFFKTWTAQSLYPESSESADSCQGITFPPSGISVCVSKCLYTRREAVEYQVSWPA